MFSVILGGYLVACVAAAVANYRDGAYSSSGSNDDDTPNYPYSGDYGGV